MCLYLRLSDRFTVLSSEQVVLLSLIRHFPSTDPACSPAPSPPETPKCLNVGARFIHWLGTKPSDTHNGQTMATYLFHLVVIVGSPTFFLTVAESQLSPFCEISSTQ